MKLPLFLAMALSLLSPAFGQTFEFAFGKMLTRCTLDGTAYKPDENLPVKQGWLFSVENELEDGTRIISINQFRNAKDLNEKYRFAGPTADASKGTDAQKTVNNAEDSLMYFRLHKADFERIAKPVEGRFTFGTVILPLKVRPGEKNRDTKAILRNFDFTSEINLGLSLAIRLSRRNAPIKSHFITSLGITTIPVDANSTNGLITEKTNAAALTPTFGHIFTFQQSGLQLVTSIGFDYLSRELGQKWEYRGWPWFGLGIGFSIFSFGERGSNAPNSRSP